MKDVYVASAPVQTVDGTPVGNSVRHAVRVALDHGNAGTLPLKGYRDRSIRKNLTRSVYRDVGAAFHPLLANRFLLRPVLLADVPKESDASPAQKQHNSKQE